jgi:hypothetical protein
VRYPLAARSLPPAASRCLPVPARCLPLSSLVLTLSAHLLGHRFRPRHRLREGFWAYLADQPAPGESAAVLQVAQGGTARPALPARFDPSLSRQSHVTAAMACYNVITPPSLFSFASTTPRALCSHSLLAALAHPLTPAPIGVTT